MKGTIIAKMLNQFRQLYTSNLGTTVWRKHFSVPPVHKVSSINTWFDRFGMEELKWPAQSLDFNPIQGHWDKLKLFQTRSCHLMSVPNLTNAKWARDMLQNLVCSLLRILKAVMAATGCQLHNNAYSFWMECPASSYRCSEQATTNVYPYGVDHSLPFLHHQKLNVSSWFLKLAPNKVLPVLPFSHCLSLMLHAPSCDVDIQGGSSKVTSFLRQAAGQSKKKKKKWNIKKHKTIAFF